MFGLCTEGRYIEYRINDEIRNFFVSNESFLVVGHKNPDGDCAGSQIAIVHFLNRIGKKTINFSHGPFQRLEIDHLKDQFVSDLTQIEELNSHAVIILDASTKDRIGEIGTRITGSNTLIIDHHMGKADFSGLEFIRSEVPSTTFLVLQVIEQLGYEPDAFEADLLLYGLCTDTGFFRHITANAPEIFLTVSHLTAAGASLKEMYGKMFGGGNLAERKLLGGVLAKTESFFDEKVLISHITLEEKKSIEPITMKTEEVYRLLQLVKGSEVVILLKQEEPERYSISFRSNGKIMVDSLAEEFGGGGHKLAAGCEIDGTFQTLKERILKILEPHFHKQ